MHILNREFLSAALFFAAFALSSPAQNVLILYSTPQGFDVCKTAELSVTVTNNEPSALAGLSANIVFPAGVEYVLGTVSGANQLNVNNLSSPVFSLQNLVPGATATFSMTIFASCALVDDINSGATFENQIIFNWTGGSKSATTIPYKIETPLLVFASTTGLNSFGGLGEQKVRTFTIRNNRLGALENFTFTDSYPSGGFTVSSNVGSVVSNTGTLFSLHFSGGDFQQIGDGDNLFEINEEIMVVETCTITDCGTTLNQSPSLISVAWGCGTEICQNLTTNAKINIYKSEINPKLVFTPQYSIPVKPCDGSAQGQNIVIKNIGDGPAFNTVLNFSDLSGGTNDDALLDTLNSFIARNSDGTKSKLPILETVADTLALCPQIVGFQSVKINLPTLAAGDSVEIFFNLRACTDDHCFNFAESWVLDFDLNLNCPPGILDTFHGPIWGQVDTLPYYENLLCIKESLKDDEVYSFDYKLHADMLRDSTGKLRVNFELPCGMTWSGGNFKLEGRNPTANGTIPGTDFTTRWFEFALPFDSNFVRGTVKFKWDCDANCPVDTCVYAFSSVANCPNSCDFDPDSSATVPLRMVSEFLFPQGGGTGCSPAVCETFQLVVDCQNGCTVQPKGWLEHEMGFGRISLGKPDNDDDRLADASGNLDFSKIRTDRFLPGDTAQTILRGVVHAGQPGATFENAVLKVFFESHQVDKGIQGGTNTDYNAPGDIVPISRNLKIVDASSGQTYDCDLAPAEEFTRLRNYHSTVNINNLWCIDTFDFNQFMFFQHDVSPAKLIADGCPLPANFKFAEGDSIVLTARHRFMKVIESALIFNFRAKTFASVFNGGQPSNLADNHAAPEADFSCNCPHKFFQISGLRSDLTRMKVYLEPCGVSDKPLQQRLSVLLGADNFFPFEFRPLCRIFSWENNLEAPVEIAFQSIESIKYHQNGANFLTNLPLPFVKNGTRFIFNTDNFAPVDEGFTIQLHQNFTAPCSLNQLRNLASEAQLAWASPLPLFSPGTVMQSSRLNLPNLGDTTGFIPLRPFLFASGNNLNYISSDDKGIWDLNFIHSSGNVPAENAYIYFQSSTGALTNFQVLAMPSQTPVPQINGVFQLGSFQTGEVKTFRIIAQNGSCLPETLQAFYGWNCDQVTSTTSSQNCSIKTISMSVTAKTGELELDLESLAAPVNLCETTGYVSAEVFNALQGAAFDVRLEIGLPPGMSLSPGTCQLSYPTGTAWKNIANPSAAPGFGLGWNLEDLDQTILQNGLAGFQNAPANSASIRFKTTTECGFVSGSQIKFTTFGNQNCGDSTNILVKPGEPILLNGVPPPAPTFISLDTGGQQQPINCGEELNMEITFYGSAVSGNRDSLFVILPAGAKFTAGSYVAGANAPTAQPIVQNSGGQQILKWKLKNAVPAQTNVVMNFKVKDLPGECGKLDTIFVKTTTQQSAVCVATGSICDATATSGEAFFTVETYHPQFSFQDFDVDFNAGIAAFHVKLKNEGSVLHTAPTLYKFYRDNDASGNLSPGDVKMFEHAIFFPIGPGDVVDLAAGLPVDLADICHLIVVIEADDVCACQTVSFPIDDISRDIPMKTVCSGAFINLGVLPIPGHQYQWIPSTGLACDTCAFPQFYLNNETAQPVDIQYVFTETAGDCSVTSTFTATVLPMPHIILSDDEICAGETVTLSTTPAVSLEWFGSGISNPNAATQTVSPIATSTYFVKITDSNSCVNFDTVVITVLPVAFAEIGPDTLGVCGNTPLQFEAFFDPTYKYTWSPGNFVSDPTIHNPFFTGTSTVTLTLTVEIPGGGCASSDKVFVGFSENPTVNISQNQLTNCFGDTAFVSLSGAQDYFWAPSAGVFCQNPSCSSVMVMPEVSTVYTILGYNNFGCKDEVTLDVKVPGKVQATTEKLTACPGETVLIFNIPINQPGVYCSPTLQGWTGCDSTHCVFFEVLDTVVTLEKHNLCPGEKILLNGIEYDKPGNFCQTEAGANGCDSTHCVKIEAWPAPQLDTFYRQLVAENVPVTLDQLPAGFEKYEWSPKDFLTCTDCQTPGATFPPTVDSMTYSITVTNAGGCTQIVQYRVRVLPPCDPKNVPVPNAFTPDNGDQTNQTFKIPAHEGFETLLNLKIYNRWGELLFETSSPENVGWDGTDKKGNRQASDVYVYVLAVGCSDEGLAGGVRVGDVSVLR